jgi:hypothetical protein
LGELYAYSSGWKRIENGTDFKYHNGSGYVNPSSVYVYNNGWSEIWKKSDPVTYSFYPWTTTNFRRGSGTSVSEGSSTTNDVYIGAFAGSFPYHYFSIMSISELATNGSTNIKTVLATRPNITSVTLTMKRQSSSGVSSPSGTVYFGTLSDPYPWTVDYGVLGGTNQDWSPTSSGSITGLGFNTSKTFTIDKQHIYDMVNNNYAFIVAGTTSGFTTAVSSSTANYMRFYGSAAADANKPYWTITFDY